LEDAGQKDLVAELSNRSPDDPLVKWDAILKGTKPLLDECQYERAIKLLGNALIDNRKLVGPGVHHYNALTHGTLGHCYFGSGNMDVAKGHYEQAMRHCQDVDDKEGILVYVQRLYEAYRYLGERSLGADYALRWADIDEDAGRGQHARYMRNQANLVRQGEPLLRMVMWLDGEPYEIDDAPRIPGTPAVHEAGGNRSSACSG